MQTDSYEEQEPEYLNVRLWELYKLDCETKHLSPRIKDYLIWVKER